jgi:outer membrane protein OmpA-like peptidoglycan-associated protein
MLQRALKAGVSMAALAVLSGGALAGPTGWYVGLQGGVSEIESTSLVFSPGPVPVAAEFDTGWAVMGSVGYRWDSNWRLEFELAFRSNDLTTTAPAFTGEITQFSQMLNAYYDFHLAEDVTLSLGAGVGGNMATLELSPFGPAIDDDYVLAGQLIAQLSYRMTRQLELFLDARYFVADEPVHNFGAGSSISYEDDKFAVMVGLRYDLTEDADPLPPITQGPPPPPPPPPQVARQYIVFFGWNKFNLTRQAKDTVAQAAATAKQLGSVSIIVVGHTDTSGGARYNQRLSERRANTVANELVRNGISAEQISAMGKGETELLVQTGDSMREPQNRRVQIDL